MRSIFLSPEQVFGKRLALFATVGVAAPASDLALLTAPDDGFLTEPGGGINYYLSQGEVDRFGRSSSCRVCAVRPAVQLDEGEERLLGRIRREGGVSFAEFGRWPTTILDESLRDMARREAERGSLRETGRQIRIGPQAHPVYQLGAKQIVRLTLEQGGVNGYVQLSDGSLAAEGEEVFLELRPVRWLYDAANRLLVSCQALFGGMSREEAETLIGQMQGEKEIWISSENRRKEAYHEIIKRGERRELVQLIKTLYKQQAKLRKVGKRLYRTDEKYYKDAKKILFGELAHVLEMDINDVEPYILERVGEPA